VAIQVVKQVTNQQQQLHRMPLNNHWAHGPNNLIPIINGTPYSFPSSLFFLFSLVMVLMYMLDITGLMARLVMHHGCHHQVGQKINKALLVALRRT
jgi:hypothetical protein